MTIEMRQLHSACYAFCYVTFQVYILNLVWSASSFEDIGKRISYSESSSEMTLEMYQLCSACHTFCCARFQILSYKSKDIRNLQVSKVKRHWSCKCGLYRAKSLAEFEYATPKFMAWNLSELFYLKVKLYTFKVCTSKGVYNVATSTWMYENYCNRV